MLLNEIANVLSFAAFRPDADDPELTWGKRFAGRRSLLLNVSRAATSWRAVDRKGRLADAGSADGELAEIAPQKAEEWRNATDGGWCSVSLNNRFIISLESNLSRRENFAELLRSNPKAVLGSKFDRGKRYAVFHHPETAASILMACDDAMVKSVEDACRATGLKAGRICCGLFALMEQKLREIYRDKQPEATGSFLLIASCEGSIAALLQQDGLWTDIRCRSGLATDTPEPAQQIIAPLISKITPGTSVFFVHDGIDPKYAQAMIQQLSQSGAKDVSSEDMLWKLIGTN